jgi:hypothetical protein
MIRRTDRDDVPGRWSEGLLSTGIEGTRGARRRHGCNLQRDVSEGVAHLPWARNPVFQSFHSFFLFSLTFNNLGNLLSLGR